MRARLRPQPIAAAGPSQDACARHRRPQRRPRADNEQLIAGLALAAERLRAQMPAADQPEPAVATDERPVASAAAEPAAEEPAVEAAPAEPEPRDRRARGCARRR